MIILAQYLKLPRGTPVVWDSKVFGKNWMGLEEWSAYYHHMIKMEKSPEFKTHAQYPIQNHYFFFCARTDKKTELGVHLISVNVKIQGDVITLNEESFYRHGFISEELFNSSFLKRDLGEISKIVNSIDDEGMDNILQKQKYDVLYSPVILDSYSELTQQIQLMFGRMVSK
mgnify:CR=1 FL=1